MKVMFAMMACVVIDDDGEDSGKPAPSQNPLDDLIGRLQWEMQHDRDAVQRRVTDGTEVA